MKQMSERVLPPSMVGKNPAVIAPFLKDLFERFNRSGIKWAVMRGWEHLPDYTRNDVDILVDKSDKKTALKISAEIAKDHGWNKLAHLKISHLHSFWYLLEGESGISYLRLDFKTEESLRGISFVDSKMCLGNRLLSDNGIYHFTHGDAACGIVLKELLANGCVKGQLRLEQIKLAADIDLEKFKEGLANALKDDELVDKICDHSKNEEWDELALLSVRVRQRIYRFNAKIILGFILYVLDAVRLQLFPCLRLFVAFIGPDGCGKSSVADGVVETFKHRPFLDVYRIHGRFQVFPRIRVIWALFMRLFGKKVVIESEAPPGTRHVGMQPALPLLRSMIYITYYGLESFFARFSLLKWRAFTGLLIADRYYYDFYSMIGHSRCPRWYLDLIGLLVPSPNILFVLERPAEDIYRQKPELTVDEIKRQQRVIRHRFTREKQTCVINASEGLEKTIQLTNDAVEQWLISKASY